MVGNHLDYIVKGGAGGGQHLFHIFEGLDELRLLALDLKTL
jgi:hypothetical protein